MGKTRTVGQYRAVDLTLYALMLLVFEGVIIVASARWFPGQPWTVSVTPALVGIVLVRWGAWAGIHAALGGVVLCALSRAGASQWAVYCVGNLFPLLLLPLLSRWRRRAGVFRGGLQAVGFGLAVLLTMQCGRAAVSLVLGAQLSKAAGCFTTEVVTDLFTLMILWIARRLDGMLEDQERYYRRINETQTEGWA